MDVFARIQSSSRQARKPVLAWSASFWLEHITVERLESHWVARRERGVWRAMENNPIEQCQSLCDLPHVTQSSALVEALACVARRCEPPHKKRVSRKLRLTQVQGHRAAPEGRVGSKQNDRQGAGQHRREVGRTEYQTQRHEAASRAGRVHHRSQSTNHNRAGSGAGRPERPMVAGEAGPGVRQASIEACDRTRRGTSSSSNSEHESKAGWGWGGSAGNTRWRRWASAGRRRC